MKISIGCDHGGYDYKTELIKWLSENNEVIDCGCNDNHTSVDYPDYAIAAALLVSQKKVDFGIVICRSGVGVSIAANKVQGVRCAALYNNKLAMLCKQHNNANMIAFGADFSSIEEVKTMIKTYMESEFLGNRHENRVNKISEYEKTH